MSIAMAGKKIKLDKEAISEILVADTNSESGSEASDFEGYLEKEEGAEEEEEEAEAAAAEAAEEAAAVVAAAAAAAEEEEEEIKTQAATSGGLQT